MSAGLPKPCAPALELINASAAQGGRLVVHGVNLRLAAGRWTSVVGPNGAGKSTLLQLMAHLLPAQTAPGGSVTQAAQVLLHGQAIASYSNKARATALTWAAQNQSGADEMRVADVVMLARLAHMPWGAAPTATDHAAVQTALEATQAWAWRHRLLGQLSGGERQRVLLARALATQADVLLLDEPLANLDPPHQSDVLTIVRSLVQSGKTVVTVLHELSMALLADDLLVMDGGRVLHHGPCASAQTHAALGSVFGGRVGVHRLGAHWVALPTAPGLGVLPFIEQ